MVTSFDVCSCNLLLLHYIRLTMLPILITAAAAAAAGAAGKTANAVAPQRCPIIIIDINLLVSGARSQLPLSRPAWQHAGAHTLQPAQSRPIPKAQYLWTRKQR
jgi:hypothetical protein